MLTWLCAVAAALLTALAAAPQVRAEAAWSFDPASWDFGVVVPGDGPTPPKAFTLTNTGDVELSPSWVGVGGSGGSGFAVEENKCGGGLNPGASCTISVSFNPSTAGPKSGQLDVAHLGGGVAQASASLAGTGAGPVVSISPSSRSFDPLDVGAGPSAAKRFTVSNQGQLDLTIGAVSVGNVYGDESADFAITAGTCAAGTVVPPGGACTVDVAFAPTLPGLLSSHLRVVDDAPGSAHLAAVEGWGNALPFALPTIPAFTPPTAGFFRRPAKRTRKRRAAFWFRGSSTAARFYCRLDGRQLHACSSPARFRHLRPGRHRFSVRAIDGNGRGGRARVFRWRIARRAAK